MSITDVFSFPLFHWVKLHLEKYSTFISIWMCKSRFICLINPLYNLVARLPRLVMQKHKVKVLGTSGNVTKYTARDQI